MKKILLSILLLLTLMPAAQAQKMGEAKETDTNLIKAALKGWHVRIGAGVSLGGTSPMPLPAEIRKINSYNPTLCIQLEGAVHIQSVHAIIYCDSMWFGRGCVASPW
jgi:hypothetical protein